MILSTYCHNDVIEKWNKCFHSLDEAGTGYIKISQVITLMKDSNLNKSIIEDMEREFSNQNDGIISYSDFITNVINFKKEIREEDVEKAFKQLNIDKSGKIGVDDLHSLIKRRGHDKLSPETLFNEIENSKVSKTLN